MRYAYTCACTSALVLTSVGRYTKAQHKFYIALRFQNVKRVHKDFQNKTRRV